MINLDIFQCDNCKQLSKRYNAPTCACWSPAAIIITDDNDRGYWIKGEFYHLEEMERSLNAKENNLGVEEQIKDLYGNVFRLRLNPTSWRFTPWTKE